MSVSSFLLKCSGKNYEGAEKFFIFGYKPKRKIHYQQKSSNKRNFYLKEISQKQFIPVVKLRKLLYFLLQKWKKEELSNFLN